MGFPQHLSLDENREFLPLSYQTYSPFVSLAHANWIVSTLHPPLQAIGLLPAKDYETLMKLNINKPYLMSGDSLVSLSFLFWALCLTCQHAYMHNVMHICVQLHQQNKWFLPRAAERGMSLEVLGNIVEP
jgi:hypothetical protein